MLPEISLKFVIDSLKPIMENKNIRKIGQNIKYDMLVLKNHGINTINVGFDTMIGAYVLKPESNYKMDYLSEAYINYRCTPISEILGLQKHRLQWTGFHIKSPQTNLLKTQKSHFACTTG